MHGKATVHRPSFSAVFRIAAGSIAVGNGTNGNATGLIAAGEHTTTPVTITGTTPAIAATSGLQTITLSGNTTPTVSGIASGQHISFEVCQPATGGPYTWTWPAAFHGGMTIGTTANTCSAQSFNSLNGTTFIAESAGIPGLAP